MGDVLPDREINKQRTSDNEVAVDALAEQNVPWRWIRRPVFNFCSAPRLIHKHRR